MSRCDRFVNYLRNFLTDSKKFSMIEFIDRNLLLGQVAFRKDESR